MFYNVLFCFISFSNLDAQMMVKKTETFNVDKYF